MTVAFPPLSEEVPVPVNFTNALWVPFESSAGPLPESRGWRELVQSPPPEITVVKENTTVRLHKSLDLGAEWIIYIHLEDEFKSQ